MNAKPPWTLLLVLLALTAAAMVLTDEEASALKRYKAQRAGIKGWLTRGGQTLEAILDVSPIDTVKLQSNFDSFQKRHDSYRATQSLVEGFLTETELICELDSEGPIDDSCIALIAKCNAVLHPPPPSTTASAATNSNTSASSSSTSSDNQSYIIPKISLIPFAGDLLKWLPFIQGWENSIGGNPSVPNRVKLSLLQQYVKTPAAETISFYSQIDENYEKALSALKAKYGDVERLIDAHIEELLSLKEHMVSWPLAKVYDHLVYLIHALEILAVTRDQYGIILVPMLKNVFPTELKLSWAKFDYECKRAYRLLVDQAKLANSPIPDQENRLTTVMRFLQEQVEISALVSSPVSTEDKHDKKSNKTEQKKKNGPSPPPSHPSNRKHDGTANFVNSDKSKPQKGQGQQQKSPVHTPNNTGFTPRSLPPCPFCQSNHHPESCQQKFEISPSEARQKLTRANRCLCCLGLHPGDKCRLVRYCPLCGQEHHPIVCSHRQRVVNHNMPNMMSVSHPPPPTAGLTTNFQFAAEDTWNQSSFPGDQNFGIVKSPVVHQTATVIASTSDANKTLVRCLMDVGAGRTYVIAKVCDFLQPRILRYEYVQSHGFGGHSTNIEKKPVVELTLSSRHNDSSIVIEALVTDQIADCHFEYLPHDTLNFTYLKNLQLADDPSFAGMELMVLIGLDYYWSVVGDELLRGPSPCYPVAVSSKFGWLVSGPAGKGTESNICNLIVNTRTKSKSTTNSDLNASLEKFWELESIGISSLDSLTSLEQLACQMFEETINFTGEIYSCGLPWRPNHPPLLVNRRQVLAIFRKIMAQLEKKPELLDKYTAALHEFEDSGFVEDVTDKPPDGLLEYYLPHRPVQKTEGSYKVRPVYNASIKGSNGVSLNDCLLPGPSLIPQVWSVMLRLRQWQYAFIGDIMRAFLHVGIQLSDRDVLRYIWNNKVWRFCRAPFGSTSSPFLLNAVIRHHLKNYQNAPSELLQDMSDNFYVDDYSSGANSPDQVVSKILLSTNIMKDAGMKLRKWSSNCNEALDDLRSRDIELDDSTVVKVLGSTWDIQFDTLSIRPVHYDQNLPYTKRNIASFVAKAFDVLGIASPIVIRGKILLQRLWKLGLPWDDLLTDYELLAEMNIVVSEFQRIHEILIPRWYLTDDSCNLTLHLFCDASQDAYCSCIYLVSNTGATLVTCKSRVSPISPEITLAKLELTACYAGAKLLSKVRHDVPLFHELRVYCWTDSQITLSWICTKLGQIAKREIFISNRVRDIQKLSGDCIWNYVSSCQNPADKATRPVMTVDTLMNCDLWNKGPIWLQHGSNSESWPCTNNVTLSEITHDISHDTVAMVTDPCCPETLQSTAPESQTRSSVAMVTSDNTVFLDLPVTATDIPTDTPSFQSRDLIPSSDAAAAATKKKVKAVFTPPTSVYDSERGRLTPAVRTLAYVLRWLRVVHIKRQITPLPLGSKMLETSSGQLVPTPSFQEMNCARLVWLKLVQHQHFREEICQLKQNLPISKTSKLYELRPELDDNLILRSRGREHRAYKEEPPIILPDCLLTELIIFDQHERLFHTRITGTLSELRRTYWIIRGRQVVRRVLNQCLICRRHLILPYIATTSALPKWRIQPRPAWASVGIDFAGPVYVKNDNGKVTKVGTSRAYILIITCCNTRAVHLEVTHNQVTESVIQAIRRFRARRVYCDFIASDNAKSFLRARRFLSDVEWYTIPERAPWWGGFYERMVQSVKRPLKKCLARACLSFEELRTVVPEIELCINLRPITYLYDDRDEPLPLRPIDFIVTADVPEITNPAEMPSIRQQLRRRYEHRQTVLSATYKRFMREYIAQLHQWKGFKPGGIQPKVGHIVLVDPLNLTNRAFFPLGKITELIIGKDGVTRAVYVLTRGSILRRSVQHLYPLETCDTEDVVSPSENSETPTVTQPCDDSAITEAKIKTRSGRLIKKPDVYQA